MFVAGLFVLLPLALFAGDPPSPPADKPKTATAADRVPRVLLHLRKLADANADANVAATNGRKTADDLADHYLRELAVFCLKEQIPTREYLIALGIGLDSSDFLRRHPLTRGTFKSLDTNEERDRRRKVVGEPTVRKRTDWLLHFALSAALTAGTNADTAELLGIGKELQDALGPSGFSFGDLAADYAGIAFANHLLAKPERLTDVAKSFRGDAFLPAIGDLQEGLSLKDLSRKYGDPGSDQFRAACRSVRERIDGQAVYKAAVDLIKTPESKK